jgi:hypothetical protein
VWLAQYFYRVTERLEDFAASSEVGVTITRPHAIALHGDGHVGFTEVFDALLHLSVLHQVAFGDVLATSSERRWQE